MVPPRPQHPGSARRRRIRNVSVLGWFPLQGVSMMGVGQDVAVEYLGELAVVVVGELPVGCPFGLGVVHRLQADPVIARKRTEAGGSLLPPVGQRVGLGMSGLVDDQEPAAVGALYVDQVPLVG